MKAEIEKTAFDYINSNAVKAENTQLAFGDFINGAEWMQKKTIEKACEWIESYLFDIGFPDDWCRDSATMKSGKQRFLEAMEE